MIATAPQWRRNTEPTKYASPGRAWVYESGGRTADGGCTWDEIPEDERDPDNGWTHWLSGWTSTERATEEDFKS